MKIVIYVAGGLVSGVFADQPEMLQVVLVDRDEQQAVQEETAGIQELTVDPFDEEVEDDFKKGTDDYDGTEGQDRESYSDDQDRKNYT